MRCGRGVRCDRWINNLGSSTVGLGYGLSSKGSVLFCSNRSKILSFPNAAFTTPVFDGVVVGIVIFCSETLDNPALFSSASLLLLLPQLQKRTRERIWRNTFGSGADARSRRRCHCRRALHFWCWWTHRRIIDRMFHFPSPLHRRHAVDRRFIPGVAFLPLRRFSPGIGQRKCLHRSLVRLLCPARCANAFRCTHLFALSLTPELAGK